MPSPTAQTIGTIVERLKQACSDGTREPTATLTADEHRALLDLHIHDPMAAGVVLQHIREHARALENWTEPQVNRISFTIYVQGARRHEREQAGIERGATIIQMAAQRNARVRRARTHDVSGDTSEGLSTAQMVETDSTTLVAIGLIRQHRGGRLWYDEFYKATRIDWRGDTDGTVIPAQTVSDEHVGRIMQWLHALDRRLVKLSMPQVNQLLDIVAYEDKRNEPRDWMMAQQWDGMERLASVFTRGLGAPDSAFNREAGRCWFVSMAARVAEPGCKVDTMPVLIGPQGIRKSQALEVIGGPWYRAAASSVDSKDFLQEMHGVLVLEVPELHSMMSSRHGATKIKAVLSTRIDHFRLPYGLRVGEHKRTCVICGTTNNRDWHSDETGARRFWPVHCGTIDLDWIRNNRAQLFAEAMAYYRARIAAMMNEPAIPAAAAVLDRGQWWNVPLDEQAALMEEETYVSPLFEMISARLHAELARSNVWRGQLGEPMRPWDGTAGDTADWGNLLTVTRVGVQWLNMTQDQLGRGSGTGKTIGACMRSLGWTTRQVRVPGSTERAKVYVLSPIDSADGAAQLHNGENNEYQNTIGDIGDIGDTIDDEAPF